MIEGELIKCACGCGDKFRAHRNNQPPYSLVRYLKGHSTRQEHAGKHYNRLEVIERFKGKKWLCVCRCGNFMIADGWSLTSGDIKSCGCLRREQIRHLGYKYGAKGFLSARNSKHEQLLMPILDKLNVKYSHQRTFSKKDGRGTHYIADFYLPGYKVALEVDGDGHRLRKQIIYDIKRDKFLLRKYGVVTIRLRNKDVETLTHKELKCRIHHLMATHS